jgi:bifunctional non-homologous end joining protein LigD
MKDPTGVAALYLGKREGNDLVYMGHGRDGVVPNGLQPNPQAARRPKSNLTKQVRQPKAIWVDPVFVADIECRDITSEGLLRASTLKGPAKGRPLLTDTDSKCNTVKTDG